MKTTTANAIDTVGTRFANATALAAMKACGMETAAQLPPAGSRFYTIVKEEAVAGVTRAMDAARALVPGFSGWVGTVFEVEAREAGKRAADRWACLQPWHDGSCVKREREAELKRIPAGGREIFDRCGLHGQTMVTIDRYGRRRCQTGGEEIL